MRYGCVLQIKRPAKVYNLASQMKAIEQYFDSTDFVCYIARYVCIKLALLSETLSATIEMNLIC